MAQPSDAAEKETGQTVAPARTGSELLELIAAGELTASSRAFARRRRLTEVLVRVGVLGLVLLSVLAPLSAAGLWDPFELDVVEKARRIGGALFGFHSLLLEGADNHVPTLEDLGRGQLPFSLIAVSLGVFGLHEWAARLPLVLCSLAALGAIHWLVRRLADRRAADYSMLVLATTPLFFTQARNAFGHVVSIAAVTLAVASWALVVFEENSSRRSTLVGLVVGSIMTVLITLSSGLLVGCTVPCAGVGTAWLCLRASRSGSWSMRDTLGGGLLALGLAAAVLAGWVLHGLSPDEYSVALGGQLAPPEVVPTHDFTVHRLGHALFPWSALVPVALANGLSFDRAAPSSLPLRLVCLSTLLASWAVHALLAPALGDTTFVGVAFVAALIGIAWHDLEAQASTLPPWRYGALAVFAAAPLILLVLDFKDAANTSLAVFPFDVDLPAGFDLAKRFFVYGGLLAAGLWAVALYAKLTLLEPRGRVLASTPHRAWWSFMRRGYDGNLATGLGVVALVGLIVGSSPRWAYRLPRKLGANRLEAFADVGWVVLGCVLAAVIFPHLILLLKDVNRWLFGRLPVSPITIAHAGFVGVGLALSLGYYPALARAYSPKDAFQTFGELAAKGEELGVIRGKSGSARYYIGRKVHDLPNVEAAAAWLFGPSGGNGDGTVASRRWLVIKRDELAALNAEHRARSSPASNVPIVGESGEVLVAVSRLANGEANQNPLDRWLPVTKPRPTHPADFAFGEGLVCLGWEVTDSRGMSVDSLDRGDDYELTFYYEADGPIAGDWKSFIHLDGAGKRVNGDHETLAGEYPFRFWRKGDFIADRYQLNIPSSYGVGKYSVYFGFYTGARRLKVTRGQATEDRPLAGYIQLH